MPKGYFGRMLRSPYLVAVALVPSISRAEVLAHAVYAKHKAAGGTSTSPLCQLAQLVRLGPLLVQVLLVASIGAAQETDQRSDTGRPGGQPSAA
eukprot:1148316-Pelagomonas_calceolata.AAC.7